MVPRSICTGNWCLSDPLDETESLKLPTILNDLLVSGKDQEGPGNNCYGNTNLAHPSLVPSPPRNVLKATSSVALTSGPTDVIHTTTTSPCFSRHLQLATWMVSSKASLHKEFLNKLPSYSGSTPGIQVQQGLTTAPGHSGVAGVNSGKLILFAPQPVPSQLYSLCYGTGKNLISVCFSSQVLNTTRSCQLSAKVL